MGNGTKVFISHTTRDSRDHNLARRLAEGLEERGGRAWIAPDSIPVGAEWRREIVDAIMGECTHFLVILSAAAIEAEWVLREIELAEERCEDDPDFTVMPLVVGDLSDYPGQEFINRHQYVPYHDGFAGQLDAVVAALGLPPGIPEEFRGLIREATQGFVGREHVFEAIEEFMAREDRGYFILKGDPGEGKSAMLAEYVRRNGCPVHMNSRAEGVTSPAQFLDNVCTQLVARYGLSGTQTAVETGVEGTRLRRLLEEAATQLDGREKLVVAVDALDEVERSGRGGGNILHLPSGVPDGVYFILTTRRLAPEKMPLYARCPQRVYDLIDHPAECEADIRQYLERASEGTELRTWMSDRDMSTGQFVAELQAKSERNFMYLHYVLPEIERGDYRDLAIEQLPSGLEGYYEDHWQRMGMTADPLPRDKINLVYILCEVREPVSRELALDFAREGNPDLDAVDVQRVLEEWNQFLHVQPVNGQKRYSVYHSSFRDFLHRKDIVEAAGVTLQGINTMITDNLWRDLYPQEGTAEGNSDR